LLNNPIMRNAPQSFTVCGSFFPLAADTIRRKTAAIEILAAIIVNGGISATAVFIKKNELPQIMDSNPISDHSPIVICLFAERSVFIFWVTAAVLRIIQHLP